MVKELIIKNRSVRRYDSSKRLDRSALSELVDSARVCSNAGNRQRIRYETVCGEEGLRAVRSALGFAAYLKDWGGPDASENPTGYIIMLADDDDANLFIDMGIAAASMLLLATERGLGGCIFRSFNPEKIKEALGTDKYTPRLVISLGVPSERVELTKVRDNDVKYYRENDVHMVPKLSLDDVLVIEK